ncbi:hypothetical protein [Actinomadura alba]|nr:hypothetical protein [Actinomadura alba]
MSRIAHRLAELFRIKADKVLDRAEDPRQMRELPSDNGLIAR